MLGTLLLAACSGGEKAPVIAVSQCSDDIWRTKLNTELSVAARFHGAQVRFSSADDNSARQMAQIREFVAEGVDLLIISPNQANTITPAVEEAFDAGIPVILFDRKIDSDKYTAFIGADNVEIGRMLGQYLADLLSGEGEVVEIQGLEGSSPAIDRHRGFVEAIQAFPDIHLVASPYGGWLEEGGRKAMAELVAQGVRPDAVFGQNDRMARGAYEALGRPADVYFVGVDALPDGGLPDVMDGVLTASYLYPTRGDLVMDLAIDILSGREYARETRLESALVDSHNARMLMMQEDEIMGQRAMVENINSRLDVFLTQYNSQRMVMWLLLILLVLLFAVAAIILRYYIVTRRLSKQLEETTAAKLAFFTNVSHDLRTPLTLVSGPLERLLQEPLTPEQRGTLSMARRNVDVLTRLVNNILDFRKIESGKMPLSASRFDLSAAVKEWLSGFGEDRQLSFEAEGPLEVEADMHLMERVLFNLVSNSYKHTAPGGKIAVSVRSAGGEAILSVQDDGEGIPPEKMPHIFEEFYQASAKSSGTGIGLALIRQVARLHGGDVSADSTLGQGSTFTVRIPLRQKGPVQKTPSDAALYTEQFYDSYAPADTRAKEATDRLLQDEDRPTILVVDDNADIRAYIGSLLEGEYRILSACNGREALQKASQELPDLVVSDVMMPQMDGLEFCKALKAELPTSHIPVILLTAKSLEEQRAEGYDSGADAYIAKPFSEKVLLSRIGNLLKSRIQLKQYYLETDGTAASPKENDFLSRFKTLVRERLSDSELSVEQIGAEIGLSRVQLYRKVKALTGYSPVELVRIMRLKTADSLLKTTDLTVAEVAYEVGFGSPSYFSKCFRELFGRLPAEGR